ncbi:hypothetical protein O5269_27275, partial [Escherichia coli]|nr:hypothetical protein [Escherichia coli]
MTIWEISVKADYIAQRHRRLQDQWHTYCNSWQKNRWESR